VARCVQTPSPMSRRRGGCRGARLQITSSKRAGRTGDSRPLALRKGVGRTGGVISRHSPMPISQGTHRCVQGNSFVKRTRSTSALRLFIPVLRKVVEWILLRLGVDGGKTRVGGGARSATDSRITWLILPVVICLSQRLSQACVSLLQRSKLQSMRACCVATASSRA
jgi:hypothetical protein